MHVHTSHSSSWWLLQMEPRAADQIFEHMIYPAFLKAKVLRNIQTSLCLPVCVCVCLCVWTCTLAILQAHIHTHAQSPEAKQNNGAVEEKSLAGVSLLCVSLSQSLSLFFKFKCTKAKARSWKHGCYVLSSWFWTFSHNCINLNL